MDREESAAILGAVREIAAAVKRLEDQQAHMAGELAHIKGQQAHMAGELADTKEQQAHMADQLSSMHTELQEFRKESHEHSHKVTRRLDHHDRMLMDHDRRIAELENARTGD